MNNEHVLPMPRECFINVFSTGDKLFQGYWHLSRHDAKIAAMWTGSDYRWTVAYRIHVKMKGTKS